MKPDSMASFRGPERGRISRWDAGLKESPGHEWSQSLRPLKTYDLILSLTDPPYGRHPPKFLFRPLFRHLPCGAF